MAGDEGKETPSIDPNKVRQFELSIAPLGDRLQIAQTDLAKKIEEMKKKHPGTPVAKKPIRPTSPFKSKREVGNYNADLTAPDD